MAVLHYRELIAWQRAMDGSLQEVETQLLLGYRLGYVEEDLLVPILDLSAEVGRITVGLLRSVCE